MSNQVTVVWTALPNGFVPNSNSQLRLSLFASIQVTTGNQNFRLSESGLGNWTEQVSGFSFRVNVGGVEKQAAVKNDFRKEMWTALFGGSATTAPAALSAQRSSGPTVKSYQRPRTDERALSKAEILTYNVGKMGDTLMEKYAGLANVQTRFGSKAAQTTELSKAQADMASFRNALNIYLPPDPTENERLDTLNAVGELDQYIASLADQDRARALAYRAFFVDRISRNGGSDLRPDIVKGIKEEIQEKVGTGGGVILFAPTTTQRDTSARKFISFHSPVHPPSEEARHLTTQPSYDFHEMLTMLANYPVLMRMMGLVIDVEVDGAGVPPEGVVTVVQAGISTNHQPKTHYKKDAVRRLFLPKPGADPLIKDGLLDLRSGHFSIQTADVDGALLKHLNATLDERRGQPQPSAVALAKVADSEVTPALRTLGISVLYRNREQFLKRLLQKGENNCSDPGNCELFAEDLIRGFRVDVYEEDSRDWYSLCERGNLPLPE